MTAQLATPVALLIFNRPETTRLVFEAIRRARPARLLVVADGPRPGVPGEAERCAEARAVVAGVDWPCAVETNYAPANLGCRDRVAGGLGWVFERAEEAIILEDDCAPHPDFFPFCAAMLERYRDDERVMHVGGSNYLRGRRYGPDSYFFSRYPFIWGWATWRRAWRHYDVAVSRWPAARERVLAQFAHPAERRSWERSWSLVYAGRLDTWDHQWSFACAERGGLAALPSVNLVSNLGFGPDATHTREASAIAALPTEPLAWPLRHPAAVARCAPADEAMARLIFFRKSFAARAAGRLARALARLRGPGAPR